MPRGKQELIPAELRPHSNSGVPLDAAVTTVRDGRQVAAMSVLFPLVTVLMQLVRQLHVGLCRSRG